MVIIYYWRRVWISLLGCEGGGLAGSKENLIEYRVNPPSWGKFKLVRGGSHFLQDCEWPSSEVVQLLGWVIHLQVLSIQPY